MVNSHGFIRTDNSPSPTALELGEWVQVTPELADVIRRRLFYGECSVGGKEGTTVQGCE